MTQQEKVSHYHVGWRVDEDPQGNTIFRSREEAQGAWDELRGKDPGAGAQLWDCVEDECSPPH